MSSRLFLLLDQIWHLRGPSGELGTHLHGYFEALTEFPRAFGTVLSGVLAMERDWLTGSGAVFSAHRP